MFIKFNTSFLKSFLNNNAIVVLLLLLSQFTQNAFAQNNLLQDDSLLLKPDYRNHINIPEYNLGLMPLNRQTSGTGVWTEVNPQGTKS